MFENYLSVKFRTIQESVGLRGKSIRRFLYDASFNSIMCMIKGIIVCALLQCMTDITSERVTIENTNHKSYTDS